MAGTLALRMLAATPHLHAAFCGGADPDWLAAIERGEFKPEPSIKLPAAEPEPTPEQRIAGYGVEALRRAEAWATWHAERASRRGLASGAGHLARVARTLGRLQAAVETRGMAGSMTWLAAATLQAALDVAEWELAESGFRAFARDQVVELETSHLGVLARFTLPRIADRLRQMREGYMTPAEAMLAACEDLAFAPGYPTQGAGADAG